MSVTRTLGAATLIAAGLFAVLPHDDDTPTRLAAQARPLAASRPTDIPAAYHALYEQYGHVCPDIDWALLAGIGSVETDHGRYPGKGVTSGTNDWGAAGPMQFMAATWRTVRHRHPDVGADIYAPADAIPAAAHLLCDETARLGSVRQAVFAYNHDGDYVAKVVSKASAYRTGN